MLTIWDSGAEPQAGGGAIYQWNGYVEKGSARSLLRYAETHGERLRQKYIAWIHDLGESSIDGKRLVDHLAFEDGLSYWWMTLLVEKSPYKSPITDAIRLLAIEEIVVQRKPAKLKLVSANRIVHEVLSRFCQNLGIVYEWERLPDKPRGPFSFRGIYHELPHPVQAIIFLVHYVRGRWSFRRSEKSSWFAGNKSLFLCSYFFNIATDQAEEGQFHSRYWEGLHGLMQSTGTHGNWLQLYYPHDAVPTAHAAMKWARRFNQQRQKQGFHTFLDTYLSARIVLRVLKRWLWLMITSWRLRKISNAFNLPKSSLSLWPLMHTDWQASLCGRVAISNLLWIELFDAAMRDLPPQKRGLYLCENQGWERALIHAWRKHGHGCLIAVAHATVRFWDLRYSVDFRTIRPAGPHTLPQPDLTALNGRVAMDAYLSLNYPKEAIIECEALRYGYLGGLEGRRRSGYESSRKGKILVLGDIMASATTKLLKLLEASIPYSRDAMTYIVKPHPACPVRAEDFPSLRLAIVTEPLEMILYDYEVAYASNTTSAAMDAYLAGLPVVVMLDEAELNFSPLRGQPGVHFTSTREELAAALEIARQSSDKRPDSRDFLFLSPELPRWSHLLAD